MTVQELISALQGLINEDDNGSGVASMEVWIDPIAYAGSELPVEWVRIEGNRVWL